MLTWVCGHLQRMYLVWGAYAESLLRPTPDNVMHSSTCKYAIYCDVIVHIHAPCTLYHLWMPITHPHDHHYTSVTAPQHLVCRAVQSLHINHMQMSIIEVFICRRLHMNTSMILICIWLICRLCTTLHTKCCGAVRVPIYFLQLITTTESKLK